MSAGSGSPALLPHDAVPASFLEFERASSALCRSLAVGEIRAALPVHAVRASLLLHEVVADLPVVPSAPGLALREHYVFVTAMGASPIAAAGVAQELATMTVHVQRPQSSLPVQ